SIFEAMRREDAIIVVRGSNKHGRIFRTFLSVVIGRIRVHCLEVRGIGWISVIAPPGPADRELIEPKHIHHTNLGNRGRKKIWMLVQRRSDKKAAIRAAIDSELWRRSIFVRYEPFCRPGKIIEYVLLVQPRTALPPILPVLT